MWAGYAEFGGTEFLNAARTEKYVRAANTSWFRACYDTTNLPLILGETYTTPLQDDAPWTDPYVPESYNFYGVYPLDVAGVESSTGIAGVTESTLNGGVVGRLRYSTKTIVFNVALLGADECAVEAGLRWLKVVLTGNPCSNRSDSMCGGSVFCYLSCNPCIPKDCIDLTGCLDQYQRTLRNVAVITGPTITSKNKMNDGSEVWTATFTMVAGTPFEFGAFQPVIEGFMDPDVEIPWVGGVVPDGGSFTTEGVVFEDAKCSTPTYQPVVDDRCSFISPPPQVPNIKLSCFDLAANFLRRQFVLPETYVPTWGDVVPYFEFHARFAEVRNLRVRFYADYTHTGDPDTDPCAYCGDFVVSYIPRGSTLVFDGSEQITYVIEQGGIQKRSEHLIFGSDGNPFDWPELSCGTPYIVTIDTEQTQIPPVVDMGLYTRIV
jgi:hypothetical protein